MNNLIFLKGSILHLNPISPLPDIPRIQIKCPDLVFAAGQHFKKRGLIADQCNPPDMRLTKRAIDQSEQSTLRASLDLVSSFMGIVTELDDYRIRTAALVERLNKKSKEK